MIIPMVCFSCGKPIAHLYYGPGNYLDKVKKHELDDKKAGPDPQRETAEFRALAELKMTRECCRRMFLCQQDMYTKVK